MKTQTAVLIYLLYAVPGWGQGTVNFSNDSGVLSSPPDRLLRFPAASDRRNPFGTNYAPAVGTNIRAQLYYGASTAAASSLVSVSTAPGRLRASTTSVPGTWSNGGQRTLDGFDFGSGMVKLQVRTWDITDGTSYEQAQANSGFVAASVPFLYQVPASPLDTGPSLAMSNFVGFTLDLFRDPPIFFSYPGNQSVGLAETAYLAPTVGGCEPLSLQWRLFGVDLPGKTSSLLVISNMQPSNGGDYRLVASNPYGTRTSQVATLTVLLPQLTIRQPVGSPTEIAWPTNLSSYKLQFSSNLSTATWADHPATPARQGGDFVISEFPTSQQRFFRLLKP